MKRHPVHAILAFCAILILALPAVASDGTEDARPSAVVDEPVFDAGSVVKGDKVVHDFEIRNEGSAPLHIQEVRPACGCTVAEYDEVIPPGGTGQVHAVVDTTSFAGGISKGITVLTDDPDNPRLVLTVKAAVEPKIFVRPGFARFIKPRLSEPGTVEQILFTRGFEDLEIVDVESPYPFLSVEKRAATEEERMEDGEGEQWVLTFTLDYEEAPVGALADHVRVTTNHPDQKVVEIPVSGFVRPMVVLTPEEADFGEIVLDEPVDATMVLKSYAPEGLKVTGSDVTTQGVDVEVSEVEEGHQFSVKITLDDELPMGDFSGIIRLKTDHPKKPVIEIPLRGTRI